MNRLVGKIFRSLKDNFGRALEKHRFVPRTRYVHSNHNTSKLGPPWHFRQKKKKTLFYGREKTGRRPCFYGRHFRFQQQPRVRVGDPRPRRPRIAAVPDHGPGHAAVGAGVVRRAAGQPVQRGRVGGGARPVGQQDDRGLPATDARTRGPVTGVGRYQLPGARSLVAVGAAC